MPENLYPPIPEKRYFTIGEVSDLCIVKPHVLRYWEQEFNQLKPTKRRGNRRYYQHKDVVLVRKIKSLLYDEGYTISGARHQLSQEGKEPIVTIKTVPKESSVSELIQELKSIKDFLQN